MSLKKEILIFKRFLALCLVILFVGACSETPSQPESNRTTLSPLESYQVPVAGTATITGITDPGTRFVTGEGVTHIRGLKVNFLLEGDLMGPGEFDQNSNWDPMGYGGVSGSAKFLVTWNGKTGTMTGQFSGGMEGFVFDATFTLHGSGDLEGVKWIGTIVGPLGGPYQYGGKLVIPSGM